MNSYEHDTSYLMHTRYYQRAFGHDEEPVYDEKYSQGYMKNIDWLIDKLAFHGIRYEDHVKRVGLGNQSRREYNGKVYDLWKGEDAVALFNAITGKNEPCITAEEYVKYLKERKMKHERSECNMGRD